MYDCKFGDCFRLEEEKNETDENGEKQSIEKQSLLVDCGIHNSSINVKKSREAKYDDICNDLPENCDFLLTHFHCDHYEGAVYMVEMKKYLFNKVFIPDIWDRDNVEAVFLTLLRDIITDAGGLLIDFLIDCAKRGRVYSVSCGSNVNDQYVVLWPKKEYIKKKASKLFLKVIRENGLNEEIVRTGASQDWAGQLMNISISLNLIMLGIGQINEDTKIQDNYASVKEQINSELSSENRRKLQVKLSNFGNEISIVFQNAIDGDKNILFTGDFGRKRNWGFIEKNKDPSVKMHNTYAVIKIPHHGTTPYYHSLEKKINEQTKILIPHGEARNWEIDCRYSDNVNIKGATMICSNDNQCKARISTRCRCALKRIICPNMYIDVII